MLGTVNFYNNGIDSTDQDCHWSLIAVDNNVIELQFNHFDLQFHYVCSKAVVQVWLNFRIRFHDTETLISAKEELFHGMSVFHPSPSILCDKIFNEICTLLHDDRLKKDMNNILTVFV